MRQPLHQDVELRFGKFGMHNDRNTTLDPSLYPKSIKPTYHSWTRVQESVHNVCTILDAQIAAIQTSCSLSQAHPHMSERRLVSGGHEIGHRMHL